MSGFRDQMTEKNWIVLIMMMTMMENQRRLRSMVQIDRRESSSTRVQIVLELVLVC